MRTRRRRITIKTPLSVWLGVLKEKAFAAVRKCHYILYLQTEFLLDVMCAEVYSTGRANLPGSRREREMLSSWSRMVAQLLMHSDKPETVELVPEYLRDVHKPSDAARDDAPVLPSSATAGCSTAHAPARMANGKARASARKRQRQELWDDGGCDGFDDGSPLLPPLTATGPGNGLLGGFSLDEDEGCALLEAAGF